MAGAVVGASFRVHPVPAAATARSTAVAPLPEVEAVHSAAVEVLLPAAAVVAVQKAVAVQVDAETDFHKPIIYFSNADSNTASDAFLYL